MKQYQVEKVTDIGHWESMKEEWNKLLKESYFDDVFLTYEWLRRAWDYFGRGKLFILLMKESENVICILPLCKQRVGLVEKIQLIGTGPSDYGDFIIHRNYDLNEIFPYILNYFAKEPGWNVIDIQQITESSSVYQYFQNICGKVPDNIIVHCTPMVGCLYVPYQERKECAKSEMSKPLLRRIRSREKEIKQKCTLEYEEIKEYKEAVFDSFFDMHIKRWNEVNQKSCFNSEQYRNFHEELARTFSEKRWLYLLAVRFGEVYTAFEYTFLYNDKVYDYISTHDVNEAYYCPGHLVKNHLIFANERTSINEIDFLRGEEEYKTRWTKHKRMNYRLTLYRRNCIGMLVWSAMECRESLHRVDFLVTAVHFVRSFLQRLTRYKALHGYHKNN